jgi:hypothetical protein
MVDWEKGEKAERLKWENKVYRLIDKIEKGNRSQYNKYMFIDILRKYLLEEEK